MTHPGFHRIKLIIYHRANLLRISSLLYLYPIPMIFHMIESETPLRREEVYHRLRRDILDCALPPGTELHAPELAERFAISKSPVRDALLRLEAERLVVVRPRKGY